MLLQAVISLILKVLTGNLWRLLYLKMRYLLFCLLLVHLPSQLYHLLITQTRKHTQLKMQVGCTYCVSARKISFFLDSGTKYHICRDRFCLHNFKKLPENKFVELCSADGEKFIAKHRGDIFYHNIRLHEVLYTSKTGFNVISVAELDKQGLMICIGGGKFSIYCVEQAKLVAEGCLNTENNDYEFTTLNWFLAKKDRKPGALDEEDLSEETNTHDSELEVRNCYTWYKTVVLAYFCHPFVYMNCSYACAGMDY